MDKDKTAEICPESVGGTPAARMIHKESDQLIIGQYFIDVDGNVRVVAVSEMPGRISAVCRHLTDPENMVYFLDMEGLLYEVNVRTLDVKLLFEKPVQGWHGKGMYKGQKRIVLTNNGEWHVGDIDTSMFQVEDEPENPDRLGCLAEWDGVEWRLVERRQHTDVTGPAGICPDDSDNTPLWSIGWDKRSCLLKVLDNGEWYRFRLPKANYTYDGEHGWHTEWPRIREINEELMLMDLHGMFWRFPSTFCAANTAGIRPLSSHHQMIVDFCEWDGELVLACNHSSHFDNPLLGRSSSNLWFPESGDLSAFGPRSAYGGPWVDDAVAEGDVSEPFLVAGFDRIAIHVLLPETGIGKVIAEVSNGSGDWTEFCTIKTSEDGSAVKIFENGMDAEWIRFRALQSGKTSVYLHLTDAAERNDAEHAPEKFGAIAKIGEKQVVGGLVRPMGTRKNYPNQEETRLQYISRYEDRSGVIVEKQYVIDEELNMKPCDDSAERQFFKEKLKGDVTELDYGIDNASCWIVEEGIRYRLPKGPSGAQGPFGGMLPRGQREVVTERCLWNVAGTFYEIPRDISFGVKHLRPVCTHNRAITDYCTWRGLLVLAGIPADARPDEYCVRSEDGSAGLWFGSVDDLWSLGKPVGEGGPWKHTAIKKGEPSDAYVMTGYDDKTLVLSHDAPEVIEITVEIDVAGYGDWSMYKRFAVRSGETLTHVFPTGFSAHWVRFTSDTDCRSTAHLIYR